MRSKYLFISICCHLVLWVVLTQFHFTLPEPPHEVIVQSQPIRSYIYQPKPDAILPPKPIADIEAPKQTVAIQPMAKLPPIPSQLAEPKHTPTLPSHQQIESYARPTSDGKKGSLVTRSLRSLRAKQTKQFLRDNYAEIQVPPTFNQQHRITTVKPRLSLAERRKIRINCAKTGAKSLAFVSKIMGGTITCEKLDELEGYISHRLGKSQPAK